MTPSSQSHVPNLSHVSTRRQLLQAGSISLLGLGMPGIAAMRAAASGPAAPKPRSVIFIFLTGERRNTTRST